MDGVNMADVLIIKRSTSNITVKRLETIVPSKRIKVQELNVPIVIDSLDIVLIREEVITI